jgi:hypothetical protein
LQLLMQQNFQPEFSRADRRAHVCAGADTHIHTSTYTHTHTHTHKYKYTHASIKALQRPLQKV